MKLRALLSLSAIVVYAVGTTACAETAWLAGQFKDADGKTVCIYKAGFDKVYVPAEIGDHCLLTINK